ncbi:MAG: acyl-CoA dehydrogenase family protein [Gammaproteobacteria bacterium]|nr:acyl-CoA dehydrogenase family protein [Gammaproteobacteria bacterium]
MLPNQQFSLTSEQQSLLDHADRFAREQLYSLAAKMDTEEWWPERIMRQMGELGFLGVTVSPDYGGAGMDLLSAGLILQGFARWNHAIALSWVAHDNLCANNLYRNASAYLCDKYLPKLCSGEYIGALGLTEPGAGSDALGSMRTTAHREGNHYFLNGSKIFITNGPVADVLLVYAKTDMSRGTKGISAFVVEPSFPGFQVAQKLVKMGFRGSQTAELVFDNCKVPAENLIGNENEGHKVLMSGLDFERAILSPMLLGICERALELSVDYAKTREQFGKTIASFQMIQSKLADIYVWVESMRALSYQVLAEAVQVEKGEGGRGRIHTQSAASIMFTANTTNRVLNEMVQIHGGGGYIWESEANRLFRVNKLLEIGAGTTEVRKMIISNALLR